jgi:formylglycine-generating enzyme required for sulfatase activity
VTSEPGRDLPVLVHISGGTFLMGKDGSRADEAPAHPVAVGAFRAAISPVTNAQYLAFLTEKGLEPPPFVAEERFADPGQPAVGVTWFEAMSFCEWLSARTGQAFRLPTEAEREFAALGGLPGGDWPWDGGGHPAAALVDSFDRPHAPLDACANGYGLRCMAENVHEWCSDWYAASYYATAPAEDPRGPETGKRRVSRGGAWRHREKVTRVNARSSLDPSFRYSDYGFRVYADG